MWPFKKKAPHTGNVLDEEDRVMSAQTRRVKAEIRRTRQMMELEELKANLRELRSELNGDDDNGNSDIESRLLEVFLQKLNPNSTSTSTSTNVVDQPQQVVVEQVFMQWAKDHGIPTDQLLDLKAKLSQALNTSTVSIGDV